MEEGSSLTWGAPLTPWVSKERAAAPCSLSSMSPREPPSTHTHTDTLQKRLEVRGSKGFLPDVKINLPRGRRGRTAGALADVCPLG